MLQRSVRSFVDSNELSDISFLVEARVAYAHKIILSLLSERFHGMFSGRFQPMVRAGVYSIHPSACSFNC
jgi:BTB/POZ domain